MMWDGMLSVVRRRSFKSDRRSSLSLGSTLALQDVQRCSATGFMSWITDAFARRVTIGEALPLVGKEMGAGTDFDRSHGAGLARLELMSAGVAIE